MSRKQAIVLTAAIGLIAATTAHTATLRIAWQSLNGGGAPMTNGTHTVNSSVAQSVIGHASGSSHNHGIGFWYGADSAAVAGCLCSCHADPQCDGVTNVFDVVAAVNVAFRSGPETVDFDCPASREEVTCDGVVNIFDVVEFVDVAFRSATPSFCGPCACMPYPSGCP